MVERCSRGDPRKAGFSTFENGTGRETDYDWQGAQVALAPPPFCCGILGARPAPPQKHRKSTHTSDRSSQSARISEPSSSPRYPSTYRLPHPPASTATRSSRNLQPSLRARTGRANSNSFQHQGGTPPINCRKILSCPADLPLGSGPNRRDGILEVRGLGEAHRRIKPLRHASILRAWSSQHESGTGRHRQTFRSCRPG
jgi:hypothetical protein